MGERARVRVRTVAVVLVLAAMASACGSRLPDDVLADIDARAAGGATPVAGPGSDEAATDGSGVVDPGLGTTGGTGDAGTGGTADGTSGGPAAGGPGDCRGGGATDKGVSATEIKVGAIVTASGPLPGATEGSFRGAQAYLTKVNAAGGVCGRKITLVKGDDGLDPQRARSEFLRLEPQVFSMVGGFSVADSGFGDLVSSTRIPYFGTFVDPAGRGPTVYPKTPVNAAHTAYFQYFRDQYPAAKKAAFLYADVGGVRANTPTGREAMKRVGYDLVYDSGLSAISPDFTSDVIAMRDRAAQLVYLFAFEVNMHVRLARNMRQQNFEPAVKIAQIGYNSKLIELLGDIANGWKSHLDYQPMLTAGEGATNPGLADFLAWHQRVAPGAQLDLFPVFGWAAAALFVEALRAVGPEVTRPKLLEAVGKIQQFNGGGMLTPRNPGSGEPGGCFVIVRIEGRKWAREHPATGFDCGRGASFRYG